MYSTDSRYNKLSNPSVNFQCEDRLIIYKILVNNKDQHIIIVGRQDISLNTVQNPYVSYNKTSKDPTKSHPLIIR